MRSPSEYNIPPRLPMPSSSESSKLQASAMTLGRVLCHQHRIICGCKNRVTGLQSRLLNIDIVPDLFMIDEAVEPLPIYLRAGLSSGRTSPLASM